MPENRFEPRWERAVTKFLPTGVRKRLRSVPNRAHALRERLHLAWLRRKTWGQKPGTLVRFLNYTVRINDGPNFYILYKDIFINRLYHFESRGPEPLILDCGSNIGMSILYFKHIYPGARIIGFEPDPAIFPFLQENIARNKLTDVKLVQAAVAAQEGTVTFYSDAKYASGLAKHFPSNLPKGWTRHEVPCVRLQDYLTDSVDFLKINIEGAEYEVLADSVDRFPMIREIVLEYHHFPGLPRTLHKILELLHEQGFEYIVNDFDSETNGAVRPPFRLDHETRYCLIIYARRLDKNDSKIGDSRRGSPLAAG